MKNRGFTLIEVLLAMVILVIVVLVGNLSFSVFSEKWKSAMGHFNENIEQTRNSLLLQKVFSSTSNYLIKNKQDESVYFFNGKNDKVTFVTNHPMFEGVGQALVELSVNEKENGLQQLVYQESVFTSHFLFNHIQDTAPITHSQVILEARNIRFNFYGWETRNEFEKYADGGGGKPKWQSTFNAETVMMLPYAVSLLWDNNEPVIFPLAGDEGLLIIYSKERRNGA